MEVDRQSCKTLITGGTEGIGYATIEAFLRERQNENFVITCSRNTSRHREMKQQFQDKIQVIAVDLADEAATNRLLLSQARKAQVNTVILNAAITAVPEIDGQVFLEEYVRSVNQCAPVRIIEELLPILRKQQSMVIFLTSSLAHAEFVPQEVKIYVETKRYMETKMRDYAQVAENGSIVFVSFNPGSVKTRLHDNIAKNLDTSSALRQRTEDMIDRDMLRDPKVVGQILYSIVNQRRGYNAAKEKYDMPLISGEVYEISDAEYIYTRERI